MSFRDQMKVRTSVAEVDARARVLKEEHKPVAKTEFEYYEDFWDFCFYECPTKGLALEPHSFCAGSCEHRKRLGIPPHGRRARGRI